MTTKKWSKNAHLNYTFQGSGTIWFCLPPSKSTGLQGWVPQWSNFLVSNLFEAFRRCRVRKESREKISNLAESKEKLCYESHDEGKGWEEMVN